MAALTFWFDSTAPSCDFCDEQALYDAKTEHGPWSNLCRFHWQRHAPHGRLGTGVGQRIVPLGTVVNRWECVRRNPGHTVVKAWGGSQGHLALQGELTFRSPEYDALVADMILRQPDHVIPDEDGTGIFIVGGTVAL